MINFVPRHIVVKVNREFRAKDESHLFPINGSFNATERAIRRLRRMDICCDGDDPEESYRSWLDTAISEIVNDSKNLPCMSTTYLNWK